MARKTGAPRRIGTPDKTAQQLRALRKAAGLTQAPLAKKLGRSQPWVGEREQGIRRISTKELPLIAAALKVEWIVEPSAAHASVLEGLTEVAEGQPDAAILLATNLLQALEQVDGPVRQMVVAIVEGAIAQAKRGTS
jgi:transcriptional regulator with XRE-family HTH domain